MSTMRKTYSASDKAKIALEALKGDVTLNPVDGEISSPQHPNKRLEEAFKRAGGGDIQRQAKQGGLWERGAH